MRRSATESGQCPCVYVRFVQLCLCICVCELWMCPPPAPLLLPWHRHGCGSRRAPECCLCAILISSEVSVSKNVRRYCGNSALLACALTRRKRAKWRAERSLPVRSALICAQFGSNCPDVGLNCKRVSTQAGKRQLFFFLLFFKSRLVPTSLFTRAQ